MHTLTFSYTQSDARRMFFAELLRRNGALLPALAVCGVVGAWLSLMPGSSMIGGLALGLVGAWCLASYSSYMAFIRKGLLPLQVELKAEGFFVTSPYGRTEIHWSAFQGVSESSAGIGVSFEPLDQAIYLPRSSVTPDVTAFLRARIAEARSLPGR